MAVARRAVRTMRNFMMMLVVIIEAVFELGVSNSVSDVEVLSRGCRYYVRIRG
jgi:hypothetical protein